MGNTIKVMIVDDHEMVLQGLSALISTQSGMAVVKTFTSGHEAIEQYRNEEVDVVLSDINMPEINGFETAEGILKKDPSAKIIMISMEVKKAYVDKAMEENISGYISKSAPIKEVLEGIIEVYAGNKYFPIEESV